MAVAEAGDEGIGILIAVRHLTTLANTGRLIEQSHLVLETRNITPKPEPVDIHSLVWLEPTSELVLVEWLRYRESWAYNIIGTELLRRLTSLLTFSKPKAPRRFPAAYIARAYSLTRQTEPLALSTASHAQGHSQLP